MTSTEDDRADDGWPVRRLLAWTAEFLRRKGSDSPRLDAEVLLSFALGWPRMQLYIRHEEPVDEASRGKFRDLVRRRGEGAPVAYLVGQKEFFSIPLAVTPAVLIPRADTETLVVALLAVLKGRPSPRVVDVGTGSGCIALACAKSVETATILAVDLSRDALDVARRNAETLGLAARVDFRLGSLLDPVAADGPFDAIVSNPPYIASAVIPLLDPTVRDYEPALALDGGPDGLAVVTPLIAGAPALLKVGGVLLLEIGSDQEGPVRALIEAQPLLSLAPTIRDHAHRPRVLQATRLDGPAFADIPTN